MTFPGAGEALDGSYRIDVNREQQTYNSTPDPQPPNVSTWWAFRTACTPKSCVATGALLDEPTGKAERSGWRKARRAGFPQRRLAVAAGDDAVRLPGTRWGAGQTDHHTGDLVAACTRCAARHHDRHCRKQRVQPARRDDRNSRGGRARRRGTAGSRGAQPAEHHPTCAGTDEATPADSGRAPWLSRNAAASP